MHNWKKTSIGDFIDFNPAERIATGTIAKKVPMAMLTEFERKIKGFEYSTYQSGPKFRNGDTLVAKITPCLENGKTAQVNILDNGEVAFGSSEFIVLRENEYSNNDYIFYLARSPLFRDRAISCMEGTSGRKRVNEGALKRQEILVPDRQTQRRISVVLSTLDDKIELNNRIIKELELLAKTLYDYWFIQFDFPQADNKPYRSSGGKMLYNKDLNREVPLGWKVERLGKATKTSLGGTPSTDIKEYWSGAIPWLNSGEVANFPLISTEQKISENAIRQSPTTLLPAGTVLLSITRHLRANILGIDACVNQSVVGIRENNQLKSAFLYFFIYNEIPRLMTLRTGAQQPHINKETVDSSLILIPPPDLLESYYAIADPIFKKIILAANENMPLSELRDWLLSLLMIGQVSVSDTAATAKETLGVAKAKSVIV